MIFRLDSLVERFPAIAIEGMDEVASLEQRFDRKYIVSEEEAKIFFCHVT